MNNISAKLRSLLHFNRQLYSPIYFRKKENNGYTRYLKLGGSEDYLLYICSCMRMVRLGQVYVIYLTSGFLWWATKYAIWIYKVSQFDFRFYDTEQEAKQVAVLRGLI